MAKISSFKRYVAQIITNWLPPTRFYKFKSTVWTLAGLDVGSNVRLVSSISFMTSGKIEIGDNTFIGHESAVLGGDADVIIGSNCDIAPRVTIITGTHHLGSGNKAAGSGYSEKIVIGNGVWIGACSTILAGVTIGDGAVIGAGSLVNKDIGSNTLSHGVPCRAHSIRQVRSIA